MVKISKKTKVLTTKVKETTIVIKFTNRIMVK